MNEHEIERIAAAANQLRPDWPIAQLRTLLKGDGLVNRPRRDVSVALAWVACEVGTASPYRVLESGPWWRAAGIESAGNGSGGAKFHGWNEGDPRNICGICGLDRSACAQRASTNGHEFIPRTECLPPTDPGVIGAVVQRARTCGAEVLGGTVCRLKPGHAGDHAMTTTPPPTPKPHEETL